MTKFNKLFTFKIKHTRFSTIFIVREGNHHMYKINFNQPIHVHFIGIGGISMSGLAEILLKEGFTVSGSDSKVSPLTEHLEAKGAQIFYGQKASNIIDGIDCVVYTAAIRRENAELMEAVAKKIPMLTRAELLGQLMANYKTPIAVSGTHGKTTTTSMISHILLEGDTDPTISVGGILQAIGGNIRVVNYSNIQLVAEDPADYQKELVDEFEQFTDLVNAANAIVDDTDARYEAFAKAEAYMINNSLAVPCYYDVRWCLTHVNEYTKINAMFGPCNFKYVNWETSEDAYTTAQYEEFAKAFDAAKS